MGFEFTSDMETKKFCGATRPSKVLKRKGGPLNAPKKFGVDLGKRKNVSSSTSVESFYERSGRHRIAGNSEIGKTKLDDS